MGHSDEEDKIITAEAVMAFHTEYHLPSSQITVGMCCYQKYFLIPKLQINYQGEIYYNNKNVIVPLIVTELMGNLMPYLYIAIDANSHNAENMFPLFVQLLFS